MDVRRKILGSDIAAVCGHVGSDLLCDLPLVEITGAALCETRDRVRQGRLLHDITLIERAAVTLDEDLPEARVVPEAVEAFCVSSASCEMASKKAVSSAFCFSMAAGNASAAMVSAVFAASW